MLKVTLTAVPLAPICKTVSCLSLRLSSSNRHSYKQTRSIPGFYLQANNPFCYSVIFDNNLQ